MRSISNRWIYSSKIGPISKKSVYYTMFIDNIFNSVHNRNAIISRFFIQIFIKICPYFD